MSIIEVKNLTKTFHIPHEKHNTVFESLVGIFQKNEYEMFTALRDINFVVEKGECLGVIGENGSGKSTLLKILANILRPTEGNVNINGTMASFLELGVGFQADLTAKENIYVYGTIMGMKKKQIDENLDEIFEFSGLNEFRDMKLKNFSSGMHVRLAFATAIQTKPDILLMDEVLAVGDMDFQQKCLDVFRQYIEEKRTIVFVSHDLNSIRRFCNKALLLRHGEQVAYGDTNEIIDTYVYGTNDTKALNQEIEESTVINDSGDEFENRWGNKKAIITDVKLFDKYGKENTTLFSGDPVKLRIFYKAIDKIKNPAFGFEIYDENDLYCFATNTNLKKIVISEIENEGEMTIDIKNIPFMSGKYYITVAIHSFDHKTTYDWHNKLYPFSVLNKTADVGFVAIDCDFVFNGKKLEN